MGKSIKELNELIIKTIKGTHLYKRDTVKRKSLDLLIDLLNNDDDELAGMTASLAIGFYTSGLAAELDGGKAAEKFYKLKDRLGEVMRDDAVFGILPNEEREGWDNTV